jgi:hypothetical protein
VASSEEAPDRLALYNADNNYSPDVACLCEAYLPAVDFLSVYGMYALIVGNDCNPFANLCFPPKIQAPSLKRLCTMSLM